VNKRKTDADREIRITTQQNDIQVATKSKEVSVATAEAKEAEAKAVAAEEKVITARAVEVADRARQTQVLEARTEAERKSTEIVVAAEAEKRAAVDRAEAVKTAASAEAEANRIKAVGVKQIGEAEAEVIALKNEAQNKLGNNVISFELAKQRIQNLPQALAEIVKPVASIKDIRIMHTGGVFGGGGNGEAGDGGVGFGEGLAGQLLKVHALKPMIDEVLRQAGYKSGDDPVKALSAVLLADPAPALPAASADPAAHASDTGPTAA
jgi:flotillin